MSQRLKTETLACSWDSKNHTLREKGEEKKVSKPEKETSVSSPLLFRRKSLLWEFLHHHQVQETLNQKMNPKKGHPGCWPGDPQFRTHKIPIKYELNPNIRRNMGRIDKNDTIKKHQTQAP